MQRAVDTRSPAAVARETTAIFRSIFPQGDSSVIETAFTWATDCFTGNYKGYQAVDIRYHDFEHTLQGTLCLARLLHGRHKVQAAPVLTEPAFRLGLLAILLHDTGYLKKTDDTHGTGAKYTLIHVGRSVDFAARLLAEKGFDTEDIGEIQKMICCTGVEAKPDAIAFRSELEKNIGLALATSDLLGQMAADDYLEKLPALYEEFAEAVEYSGDRSVLIASFTSEQDLIQRTPDFWGKLVRKKLDHELGGLYRFLNDPYPDGQNDYLDRIEANMERLQARLSAEKKVIR